MNPDMRITVVGGAIMDRLATTDDSAIMGASNPGRLASRPGGVGLMVATILNRLGHPVRFVSRLGRDDDAARVAAGMADEGLTTDDLNFVDHQPTGTYTAAFDGTGDLVVGVADMRIYDDFVPVSSPALAELDLAGSAMVLDANLPAETLAHLSQRAHDAGSSVAGLTVSPKKSLRLLPSLEWIDRLFTNRAEATAMLAELGVNHDGSAAGLARALAAQGPTGIVVTDGGRSLALATGNEVLSVAPPPTEVTNVNGAGDSLAAGTIHGLVAGGDWTAALGAGMAAASLTLEHGGIPAAQFSAARLQQRILDQDKADAPS